MKLPCLLPLLLLPASGLPASDLIHISDTHIAKFEGIHPALAKARMSNAESLDKFERFVAAINERKRAVVVHTGDIVEAICFDPAQGAEAVRGQIELARETLAKLRHPYHLALGNHDVECYRYDPAQPATPVGDQSVAGEARQLWQRALRRPSYYSAKIGQGYRLVVIDNGQALNVGGGQAFFEQQMKWLKGELRRLARSPVIVALHVPVTSDRKSEMLKECLRDAGNVVMVLCGHRHTDAIDTIAAGERKIPQVRTAAMNLGAKTWRRIHLKRDSIEVYATGYPEKLVERYPSRPGVARPAKLARPSSLAGQRNEQPATP